jgi:hypothetical protein
MIVSHPIKKNGSHETTCQNGRFRDFTSDGPGTHRPRGIIHRNDSSSVEHGSPPEIQHQSQLHCNICQFGRFAFVGIDPAGRDTLLALWLIVQMAN